MTIDPKINQMTLAHADIQVSPEQMMILNQKPPVEYEDLRLPGSAQGEGYQVILYGYADYIYTKEQAVGGASALSALLNRLKSTPIQASHYRLKGSVSTYSLRDRRFRVDYRVFNGQVCVFNIQVISEIQKLRDREEKVALYNVKKNGSGIWERGEKVQLVSTSYAAVNGQSNNLAKATWLMGKHLEVEFGEQLTEYTLFHNPSVGSKGDTWESTQDKLGFTTDVTKKFADTLVKTQTREGDTTWVAHSQGGVIFAEAVRYILNGNSSWALNGGMLNGIRHPEKGAVLDKQKVAMHGNANNNMRSKHLFKRAGVEVVASRGHDYDFVTNIMGLNTINPRKIVGSIVYANHVTGGSIPQSPHTTVQSMASWQENMSNGPGRGRNLIQKGFDNIEQAANRAVKVFRNYLP